MLRLKLTAGTRWIEIAPGIRFHVKPCDSTVMGMAREAAAVQELVAAEAGDTAVTLQLAKEVAKLTIIEWEGVGDEAGNPAPLSEEYISAALDVFPVFKAFQVEHVAEGLVLDAEKNGSAPLPTGPSVGATATARPVQEPVPTAPRG